MLTEVSWIRIGTPPIIAAGMSGVTCQFCGKPLWRIRRGSDGDFCSREHRNQYKLRMGLTHLAEAEKVSSARRKCEVCNAISLGRVAGSPEVQKRRSLSPRWPGRAPRLPAIRVPDAAGLKSTAVSPALPARLPRAKPKLTPAVSFAPGRLRMRPVQPHVAAGTAEVACGFAPKVLLVPLADGALSRPVFLIARFPHRAPATGSIEARASAGCGGSVTMPVACRARQDDSPAPRDARVAFSQAALRLPETEKPGDLADLPCVPQGLMPYRALENPVETRVDIHGHLVPAGSVPAWAEPKRRPESGGSWRAAAFAPRKLAAWPVDGGGVSRRLLVLPVSARVVAFPEIHRPDTQASFGERFRAPAAAAAHVAGTRRAAVAGKLERQIEKGRRAVWNGKARLPNSRLNELRSAPKDFRSLSRALALTVARHGPAIPPLLPLAVVATLQGPSRVALGVRGKGSAKTLELAPASRDLVLARFQPELRGLLTDPIPGSRVSLVEEHFERDLVMWSGDTGSWKVDIAGVRPGAPALFTPSLALADYRLEFLARVERGSLACLFRVNGTDCHVMRIANGGASFERYAFIGGKAESRASLHLDGVAGGKSLNVQLEVRGDEFAVAINGRAIDRWTDSRLPSGGVGFGSDPEDRVRLYWVKLGYRTPENSGLETLQS
jgi:hypothetical protein